jgi:hypothetical protein
MRKAMRGGGIVLDARHVIADVDMCCGRTEQGLQLTPMVERNDFQSGARMVWKSPGSDMVILELERPIDLPAATLMPAKLVSNGQPVYIVNFPEDGRNPRVAEGKITDRKKFPQKDVALHAATTPMERLNTGGGLFDACGNVVGINVQFKNGELLSWIIDGIAPGLKETNIQVGVADSACGGGGGGGGSTAGGGGTSGGGGTGGGGTSGGGGTGGGGSGGGGSKGGGGGTMGGLTSSQWIAVAVIVGIFALGFRPGTRQSVVRAITRRRPPLPEPLPYPYASPPPQYGAPVSPPGFPPPPPVAPMAPPYAAPPPVAPLYSPPAQAYTPPPPVYQPPAPVYQPPAPPPPLLAGRPALLGIAGQYAGSSIGLDSGPSTMGRDPSSVNLVFPAEVNSISKRHCRVSWDVARRVFVLEDLGSTNGTFLASGERVNPGQPRDLRPGDRFYIGDLRNQFEVRMES